MVLCCSTLSAVERVMKAEYSFFSVLFSINDSKEERNLHCFNCRKWFPSLRKHLEQQCCKNGIHVSRMLLHQRMKMELAGEHSKS